MKADVTKVDGWYVKTQAPEVSSIETTIYRALVADPALKEMGAQLSNPERMNDTTFATPDYGPNLMFLVNHPIEEREEYLSLFENRLYQGLEVRARVNEVIGATLTDDQKQFLLKHDLEKLQQGLTKQFGREFDVKDVSDNYWAYRVMNATGIDDSDFKTKYTTTVGKRLDYFTQKFGSWISNNTLYNNAVSPDKKIVPFDFNSIKYGPRQIDEASLAGMFCFDGPIAIYPSLKEVKQMVNRIQKISSHDDPEYLEAFMLCAFHEHAVMAGYKYKMTGQLIESVEDIKQMKASTAFNIWGSYDEIDYLSTVLVLIARNYGPEFEQGQELLNLANEVSEATFGQRGKWIFDDRYQRAVEIGIDLRDRFGVEVVADAIRCGRLK